MEYLQQHGFDKALAMFQAGIADHGATTVDDKDADGDDEPMLVGRSSGLAGGREAIFRAPGPVPIESTLKRNIPQAQSASASTMSERLTPEFEAQARYIIDQLQKKVGAQADGDEEIGPGGEPLLDPSDRIQGYRRYRRWVDGGLDLWKVGLGSVLEGEPDLASLNLTHYLSPSSLTPSSTCYTSALHGHVGLGHGIGRC